MKILLGILLWFAAIGMALNLTERSYVDESVEEPAYTFGMEWLLAVLAVAVLISYAKKVWEAWNGRR